MVSVKLKSKPSWTEYDCSVNCCFQDLWIYSPQWTGPSSFVVCQLWRLFLGWQWRLQHGIDCYSMGMTAKTREWLLQNGNNSYSTGITATAWEWLLQHGNDCDGMEMTATAWEWLWLHGNDCDCMLMAVTSWEWLATARELLILLGSYCDCTGMTSNWTGVTATA